MLIILIAAVLLTVVALTVPMHNADRRPSTTAVVSYPTLVAPSPSHGVLVRVFVPEDQIRSYMAAHKAKVHSSAPTAGGYTVMVNR